MNSQPSGQPPVPSHPFRWFPEFWELGRRRMRTQARLLGLALVVGIISGFGAIGFYTACQVVSHYSLDALGGYQPTEPAGETPMFASYEVALRPWMLILLPAVGGLLSGLIVYSLAPEAEGHGTDSAISAYHNRQGQIRPRVTLVKMVASALTIGTGGSGGREGPIALIGAGFGSFLGTAMRLRGSDRRVLMAAGMGSGIAAIFRAPLAGALFAAEVLYRSPEFESEVIMPAALASITAYCTFAMAFGWSPLFEIPDEVMKLLVFDDPWQLVPYTLLALAMVVLAMLYTRSFYGMTYLFHQLKLPPHVRPAIGALATGLSGVALFYTFGQDPQVLAVMGTGYGSLQDALARPPGESQDLFLAAALLAIALGKILTTGLTIGSGGSGGVFGPSMVIGGCGGGALGILIHEVWPAMVPHPAAFIVVGMAGFFAAAAKTPFSTLVIVSEMTGSYSLLLPTLWVCTLTFLLSDEQSIYSAQVESRAHSPAHRVEYLRGVLTDLTVSQFLLPLPAVERVSPGDRLPAVFDRLGSCPHATLVVTDGDGLLAGVVSLEEAYLGVQLGDLNAVAVVADLMRTDIVPLQDTDSIDRALELFVENQLLELPVVHGPNQRVIGLVRRADISSAYLRAVQQSSSDAAS